MGKGGTNADWHAIAKVGGLACLGLVSALFIFWWGATLGAKSGYYDAQSQGYASQYPYDTNKRIEECFADPDRAAAKQCTQEAITADRENKRGEYDLQAQREVADWTYYMVIISVVQIPLGILGLIALVITIQQGRDAISKAGDANKIAREAVRAEKFREYRQSRAYIAVESVIVDKETKEATYYLVNIKNFGQTPAYDVHFKSTITGRSADDHNSLIWSSKHPQLLAPTQELGLAVAMKNSNIIRPKTIWMIFEVRYKDILGGTWALRQRYISTDGTEWRTDGEGNKEVSISPPKIT